MKRYRHNERSSTAIQSFFFQLKWLLIGFITLIISQDIFAIPPFITGDPFPAEYKHGKIYLFANMDRIDLNHKINIPALKINYSILPRFQLSPIIPMTYYIPRKDKKDHAYGLGDIRLELKWAFIKENKKYRPQVAFAPIIVFPSGDKKRGLGNGRSWVLLPIWLGKTWKSWKTYGGAGYARNREPGKKNFAFGGVVVEYTLNKKWMLGGEIYANGAPSESENGYALLNLGGHYAIKKNVELLFSMGHSIAGEKHWVAYLGGVYIF